nr:CAP domain-containing protein [uncultured Anaeromusa sp.]
MKKYVCVLKMILSVLVLCGALACVPQQAQAFKLEVTNNQDRIMNCALVYFDSSAKRWSTSGWYNVPVGATKNFTISKAVQTSHMYMYAKAGNAELCGGDDAPHITRTVISNQFQYYDGNKCPDGPNSRSVRFYKFAVDENDAVSIEWGSARQEKQSVKGSTGGQNGGITQQEMQAIQLLNRDRAKNGLTSLSADAKLTQIARSHAADMARQNYFNHTNLQGQSPFDRMTEKGIAYRSAGENIAYNHSLENMQEAWMNSPGHRANILNTGYTHGGVGLYTKEDGTIYGVQLFASY